MSKVVHGVVGVLSLVGLVGVVVSCGAFMYMDGRLHDASNGYRYGPARHGAYYSDILHRVSRDVDAAAAEMHRRASFEDRLEYDRMVDSHESAADYGSRYDRR